MARPVALLSKKDHELIRDYAQLKGYRFGLVEPYLRVALFYDRNERPIKKSLSSIDAELNSGGDPKDGKHSRGR